MEARKEAVDKVKEDVVVAAGETDQLVVKDDASFEDVLAVLRKVIEKEANREEVKGAKWKWIERLMALAAAFEGRRNVEAAHTKSQMLATIDYVKTLPYAKPNERHAVSEKYFQRMKAADLPEVKAVVTAGRYIYNPVREWATVSAATMLTEVERAVQSLMALPRTQLSEGDGKLVSLVNETLKENGLSEKVKLAMVYALFTCTEDNEKVKPLQIWLTKKIFSEFNPRHNDVYVLREMIAAHYVSSLPATIPRVKHALARLLENIINDEENKPQYLAQLQALLDQHKETYFAPAPARTWKKTLKTALFWLFPVTAIYGLFQFAMNRWLGASLRQQIIPAVGAVFNEDDIVALRQKTVVEAGLRLTMRPVDVNTHDGNVLATTEISPTGANEQDRMHIIYLRGNSGCYETVIDQLARDALESNANVIGFNYRSGRTSTGLPREFNDLVIDGIAQVQRLLDRGVHPRQIILKSTSLGGAVANAVTAHFHEHELRVNVYNANSFSTITKVVIGEMMSLNESGHATSFFGKLKGYLAYPFVKAGLVSAGWETNAAADYLQVDPICREHTLIRSAHPDKAETKAPDEVNLITRDQSVDDVRISHYAALHTDPAIAAERHAKKNLLNKVSHAIQQVEMSGNLAEIAALTNKNPLPSYEKSLRQRKMTAPALGALAHSADPIQLSNRYGMTAHAFFKQFVERVNAEQRLERSIENQLRHGVG